MIEIQPIQQQKCILGEGPYWDHKHSTLWTVDIKSNLIFSFEPESQKKTKNIILSTKWVLQYPAEVADW